MQFPFVEVNEDETANAMVDDTEEEDNEDEEAELIFRELLEGNTVADETFRFFWSDAVEGGGGGGRKYVFPLFPGVVVERLMPFLCIAPWEDDDTLEVVELKFVWLVLFISIQSADVGDIILFVEYGVPAVVLRLLVCPFIYRLLLMFEDFGGSWGGDNESNDDTPFVFVT